MEDALECIRTNVELECMEPLNAEWSEPVLINSGANGRIYEVKNEEGRGFILKKMIPNPGGSSFKEEVCNQNYASRFGLSPRVFDFWSCSNCEARMMVMEKAGVMDLDQYFNLLLKDANEEKVCNFVYLVATFYFMIRALNFLGIIHLDTHFKNVMIQYKNGEGENPLIIDFGMSTFYKDYIRELKDKICSIEGETIQSFRDTVNYVKQYWMKITADVSIMNDSEYSIKKYLEYSKDNAVLHKGIKFCFDVLYTQLALGEICPSSGAGISTWYYTEDELKDNLVKEMQGILIMCEEMEDLDLPYDETKLKDMLRRVIINIIKAVDYAKVA